MKITTVENERINVTEESEVRYIGPKTIGRGFWRWVAALLLFWPAVLLYFFVGEKAHQVDIDGKEVLLNQFEYERLVRLIN